MTGRPPARLINAVLALYPAGVRDRYGPEIADLIACSPRPWRDLANVGWTALRERGGSVHVAQVRPYVAPSAVLLAAPGVFVFVLLASGTVVIILSGAVSDFFRDGSITFGSEAGVQVSSDDGFYIAGAVAAISLAAVVVTVGARLVSATLRVPAPAIMVPALLALGVLGMSVGLAVISAQSGDDWPAAPAVAATTACWWVTVMTLAIWRGRSSRQATAVAARTVAVAGTVAELLLCNAVFMTVTSWTEQSAASILDAGPIGVPAVLTVCTPFALTLSETLPGSVTRPR